MENQSSKSNEPTTPIQETEENVERLKRHLDPSRPYNRLTRSEVEADCKDTDGDGNCYLPICKQGCHLKHEISLIEFIKEICEVKLEPWQEDLIKWMERNPGKRVRI